MAKFLSDEWQEQARPSGTSSGPTAAASNQKVRMNLVINEVPTDVGGGPIDAHLDTTGGDLGLDTGHLDNAELTLSLDYDTAKRILVDGDASAGMQAFMAGKIKVLDGDMSTLMTHPVRLPRAPQAAHRRAHRRHHGLGVARLRSAHGQSALRAV